MRYMGNFVIRYALAACLLALAACDASKQEKVRWAERKKLECLDKICPGDVEPKRDPNTEVIFKVNGRWFVGPKEYMAFDGTGGFYWPSRTPITGRADRQSYPEKGKKFYDVAIEIFLRSIADLPQRPGWYEMLRQAESEGRLVSKQSPRSGLEVWRIKENDGLPPAVWYVATDLKGPDGHPPVLACDEQNPEFDRCTTGFRWQPDISVDLRFRAKHGPDWPEIYQETIRVLSLLRKG